MLFLHSPPCCSVSPPSSLQPDLMWTSWPDVTLMTFLSATPHLTNTWLICIWLILHLREIITLRSYIPLTWSLPSLTLRLFPPQSFTECLLFTSMLLRAPLPPPPSSSLQLDLTWTSWSDFTLMTFLSARASPHKRTTKSLKLVSTCRWDASTRRRADGHFVWLSETGLQSEWREGESDIENQ